MHDQLFKGLLERFFGDFVRIVLPDEAPRLRFEEVEFHRSEHFTDVGDGRRRLLDLVAEVPVIDGRPASILVHVEIEARARGRAMDRRMWRYAMVLRLRHQKPVVPVVLYVRGGPAGAAARRLDESFGQLPLASFTHVAFGLSGCDAAEYLERPEALAPALAALMQRVGWSAAEHKFLCMQRIARFRIDEAARYLLVNCVETYVQLDGEGQKEYARLLAQEPTQEVRTMQMTYAEKLEAYGMEKGLEKGLEKGRQEGMRDLVRGLLERRFGPLPVQVEDRLAAVSSPEDLTRLHERALDAGSLEELGF